MFVKRRRKLDVDIPDPAAEDRGSLPGERAPRTHQLSAPALPVLDESQSVRADPSNHGRLRPRRRARRALKGAVTIIRPEVDETVARSGAQKPPMKQALQLKQRESTVRWITQAIRRYDLTARDQGL